MVVFAPYTLNLSIGVWIGVQSTLGDALSLCFDICFLLDT